MLYLYKVMKIISELLSVYFYRCCARGCAVILERLFYRDSLLRRYCVVGLNTRCVDPRRCNGSFQGRWCRFEQGQQEQFHYQRLGWSGRRNSSNPIPLNLVVRILPTEVDCASRIAPLPTPLITEEIPGRVV